MTIPKDNSQLDNTRRLRSEMPPTNESYGIFSSANIR